MKKIIYFIGIVLSLLSACSTPEQESTQIVWDTWGVPHIYAANETDLFKAQGYAQMQLHGNMILEMYGSSRGRGAEYWGKGYLENDMLVHAVRIPEMAQLWEQQQDPQLAAIAAAFAEGMNLYATQHPEALDEDKKVVLPLSATDFIQHAMYVIFTRFIGGNDLGRVTEWPELGSNAYAVAGSRSASGNAMLVQNPHLPWYKEFTFTEQQLNLPDHSIYGATLVGFPGIAIGFSEHLGWSHTNNTIDNADTYELVVKDGNYMLDGVPKAFEKTTKTLQVKGEDGALSPMDIDLYASDFGPVVKMNGDKALAVRLAGTDSANAALQWWKMANSKDMVQFEEALQMAQIPFWNVMYADKTGNIFYLFNGLVPKRSTDAWEYWDRVIPGGKSEDIWTSYHAYAELPKVTNPVQGWLQNANDPPWTSTLPKALNRADFPGYMSPDFMHYRAQRSARMLMEDESITFDELVAYKHSTRLEFADKILDDLFVAIDAHGSELAMEAKSVLEGWDRNADADSKGTLLFAQWAKAFDPEKAGNFVKPWDSNDPVATPDGLADPAAAVAILENVAKGMKEKFGKLDVAWGDYFRINYNGKNLPANGMDGSLGVFRVLWPGGGTAENLFAGGGDSWVGVIEFGDQVKAKVLLSYGNATQKDSPHNGDQLELFAKKELRDAWFYKADVMQHKARVEILTQEGFVEQQ